MPSQHLTIVPSIAAGGNTDIFLWNVDRTVQVNSVGLDVKLVQYFLYKSSVINPLLLSYNLMSVDGQFGPKTLAALQAMQRCSGQVALRDDKVSPMTGTHLRGPIFGTVFNMVLLNDQYFRSVTGLSIAQALAFGPQDQAVTDTLSAIVEQPDLPADLRNSLTSALLKGKFN